MSILTVKRSLYRESCIDVRWVSKFIIFDSFLTHLVTQQDLKTHLLKNRKYYNIPKRKNLSKVFIEQEFLTFCVFVHWVVFSHRHNPADMLAENVSCCSWKNKSCKTGLVTISWLLVLCETADFYIDLMLSKYMVSIADANTNTFNLCRQLMLGGAVCHDLTDGSSSVCK